MCYVVCIVVIGQYDNVDIVGLVQMVGYCIVVFVGQVDIEYDDVVVIVQQCVVECFGIVEFMGLCIVLLQVVEYQVEQFWVVFDYLDS